MTTAEKLVKIAENEPKVYEAGRKEGMSFVADNVGNALKGNVSGETVVLKDVSPIEHNLGVKVERKNLADIYGFSTEGIQNVNHGRFSSNAYGTTLSTTDATNSVEVIQTKSPNASNVTSYENGYFCIGTHNNLQDGDIVTVSFDVEITSNPLNATEGLVMSNGLNAERFELKNGRCSATLAWANYNDRKYIEIRNAGCSAVFSNFQVELGTTATPYTPYIANPEEVKITTKGENMFNVYDITKTTPDGGYRDGDTLFNPMGVYGRGTHFEGFSMYLEKGYYHITADVFTALPETGTVTMRFYNPEIDKYSENVSYTQITTGVWHSLKWRPKIEYDGEYFISATGGGNASNYNNLDIRFKNIMITKEEVYDDYPPFAPYVEPTEYEYGEDIKSIHPYTMLTTDTPGALMTVEYNKDINAAFAELLQKISSLGG